MNWDRIEGNWKQFTGKVQQRWAELTDDDLQKVQGRRTELVFEQVETPADRRL